MVIIAATADSPSVHRLEKKGKIEVEGIYGKWEAFKTALVKKPLPEHGLVIIGSDKRGTMFGVYTLPEQNYSFISEFCKHVFDLLLRLEGNFMWPAMWGSFVPTPGRIFFTDDPRNQQLTDDYGIVVSTNHHEPMQQATNEWRKDPQGTWDWVNSKENVVNFMGEGVRRASSNETYFTIGMRGENDGPINADGPLEVLRDGFSTQREILAKYHGNHTSANQVWTTYKEVATYYAAGLTPPDNVT
ncbi:hypothetical protein B0J13DRAFT_629667 [Dactylonectria estremocensis]|uniref:Uncharacterized protein n=1 Tax=Dactylonectria estremocensis TaxID=1079267 RepID=A0A9P9DH36_9HYPO|nr:hypothetical protein B0J13DRAFT_629667 [Dactylonectria estremocensis]